jgi:hypothetical protein
LFFFLKESSLSVTTTLQPRHLSTTITKSMHQHVTHKSNTNTIGKNTFVFRMYKVCGNKLTSSYKEKMAVKTLTCLTPTHFCACPIRRGLYCAQWVHSRWEVLGIGGIDDHHCLNFLFIFCVQWVKVRGNCLFCWYWWNWWPSLFKLSFHILCSVS